MKTGLGGLFLLLVSLTCVADSSSEQNWYFGLESHLLYNKFGNADVGLAKLKPVALGLRLGRYIQPQVALELYGFNGVKDDNDLKLNVDLNYALGGAVRFETPEVEIEKTHNAKLYILLGYGITGLALKRSDTSPTVKEHYHGFTLGGGGELQLGVSHHFLNLQVVRYYNEDDLSIDGASLGWRYAF
jgi:hypothetical protein